MNNSLTVKIVDETGEEVGVTYPKRAKGLIKNNRAIRINENEICLLSLPKEKKENLEKGLRKIKIPMYSLSEELMSAISHGFGSLLSIAALVLCIVFSSIHQNVYAVVSSAIYGSMSIILYTMSTLYHSFKVNNAKRVFRIIDHCSIYLLIAGTYTPYSLVTLREISPYLGWSVFGIIWGCTAIGITFTAIDMNKFKIPGMILYLIMGWMILFTLKDLISGLTKPGFLLMLGAGILYSVGAVLYGLGKKIKYMHSVFHIFVLAASICFFFSIFLYVI